jgi:hypothetical protein
MSEPYNCAACIHWSHHYSELIEGSPHCRLTGELKHFDTIPCIDGEGEE